MNLSCDAAEWSSSGQVTVTLMVADFQVPESSPWAILLDVERVGVASARVVMCLAVHYLYDAGRCFAGSEEIRSVSQTKARVSGSDEQEKGQLVNTGRIKELCW